jgi:hypothetical protein
MALLRAGFVKLPRLLEVLVSSYLAFSPLPRSVRRMDRDGIFSVTLSVIPSLRSRYPRLSRGALSCGVRTFLPANANGVSEAIARCATSNRILSVCLRSTCAVAILHVEGKSWIELSTKRYPLWLLLQRIPVSLGTISLLQCNVCTCRRQAINSLMTA